MAVLLARRGVGTLIVRESLPPDGVYDTLDAYGVRVLVEPEASGMEEAERLMAAHALDLAGREE
jgi:hypothetical protein